MGVQMHDYVCHNERCPANGQTQSLPLSPDEHALKYGPGCGPMTCGKCGSQLGDSFEYVGSGSLLPF
jgi:hypothetical protein